MNGTEVRLASSRRILQTWLVGNRRRILSVLALLAVLGFLAWLAFRPSEPSYHGKSLSVWLEQARQNLEIENLIPEIQVNTPAARAVRAMGKDALPSLLRMAHTQDTATRRRMIDFFNEYEWLGVHLDPFDHVQARAAYGFYILGPAAKPALSDLISMLDDSLPENRKLAVFAISRIGPDSARAIPALQRLITNSLAPNAQNHVTTEDSVMAAYALGAIGPLARSALPQIELLRNNSNIVIRAVAVAAKIKISGDGLSEILEGLKAPLDSTNWLFAVQSLQFLGTNGAPAIPLLVQALMSTNTRAASRAIVALGCIHRSPETTIPALLPFVGSNDTNNWDRANAVDALRNFGPDARETIPVLLKSLTDSDLRVRAHGSNALRHIDPEAARKAGIDTGPE